MFNWLKRKKRTAEELPKFWKEYEAMFKISYPKSTPLEELNFVVFDTETTGLDIKKDQILSIGAVKVHNWQIHLNESFDFLVNQSYHPKGGQSIPIHGILPVQREGSLEEKEAIQAFLQYIGKDILVGHHVKFDISMVNKVLQNFTGKKLKNKYIDTGYLLKRATGAHYAGPSRTLGLDELCSKYQIPPADRHTAAGDAYITALLFMKLLAQLKKRGIKKLGDLLR